jgi:hypothetical protein
MSGRKIAKAPKSALINTLAAALYMGMGMVLALVSIAPAEAVVLNGQLEEVEVADENASPGVQPGALIPNTFPTHYAGKWVCETTITESSVPTVLPGTKVQSEVHFIPTADGRIEMRHYQPGWVRNKCLTVSFNGNEAKADTTSYYFGEKVQGAWAARTRDQYLQETDDLIKAKSYVDQYINGQYVGRYRTISVLRRVAEDNRSVASK